METNLILASASPRRKEILEMLGFHFTVCPAMGEEHADLSRGAPYAARRLAEQKAEEIALRYGGVVLGSDTIVEWNGQALGKPKTEQDACRMLHALSGQIHRVHTGVAILSADKREAFTSTAEVEFYPLSDRLIEEYVQTGEPMDKAGGYGIQSRGCVLVKGIRGDFYTIMGLPAAGVTRALAGFGVFPAAFPG